MADAVLDANNFPSLMAVSNVDGVTPVVLWADPTTHRLLTSAVASTPTDITVANEATDTTCFPLFVTAATGDLGPKTNAGLTFNSNTGVLAATGFSGPLTGDVTGNVSGNAGTVTTNANLTGPITSVGNATSVASQTGTGSTFVMNTSPTLVTPALGVATATSINGLTITSSTGTFTLTNAKTLSVTNTLTLSGTDSTTMTFPSTSATIARTDAANTFTGASTTTSWAMTTPVITGAMTLNENASLALDPAGSADGKYTGITVTGTAGAALAFGDLIYLDPTDSRWELVDANAAAAADGDARGILGICVLAAAADADPTVILLHGIVRADTAFPAFTINNPIYVSETAGDVTQTQPTTTDVVIRIVGSALTADEMYFNPDKTWVTHT